MLTGAGVGVAGQELDERSLTEESLVLRSWIVAQPLLTLLAILAGFGAPAHVEPVGEAAMDLEEKVVFYSNM